MSITVKETLSSDTVCVPTPNPRQPLITFCWYRFAFLINGIIKHMVFYVWFLSLSIYSFEINQFCCAYQYFALHSLLSSIPFYQYTTNYTFTRKWTPGVFPNFGCYKCSCTNLCVNLFSFLQDKDLEVKFLGHLISVHIFFP